MSFSTTTRSSLSLTTAVWVPLIDLLEFVAFSFGSCFSSCGVEDLFSPTVSPLLSPGLPHGLVSPVARDLHPFLSLLHNDTKKKRLIIIPRKRKDLYID